MIINSGYIAKFISDAWKSKSEFQYVRNFYLLTI